MRSFFAEILVNLLELVMAVVTQGRLSQHHHISGKTTSHLVGGGNDPFTPAFQAFATKKTHQLFTTRLIHAAARAVHLNDKAQQAIW